MSEEKWVNIVLIIIGLLFLAAFIRDDYEDYYPEDCTEVWYQGGAVYEC